MSWVIHGLGGFGFGPMSGRGDSNAKDWRDRQNTRTRGPGRPGDAGFLVKSKAARGPCGKRRPGK